MQADWYGDSWLRKPSKKTLLELYGSNNAFSMLLPCLSEPYCAKTSMSGQAAYFEVWSPTLSNKWCGKKSSGKAPSPGLLLWGFLWEAARLSHPLLHTMWCSVIIICGTVSSFQEVFQCWSSMSWVFFFSLCSILYDPKDIILCPLFSSMWRWWYFLSQRLLWKCALSVNLLPDGGFYGRTKHLPIIDFSVGEVDATLEIFFFPWVICWKDYSCTCCCCLCYTWLCLRYWWRSPPVWAVDVLPLGCPQDELPIVGQPELPSACLLAAFNGWNYTLVVQGCSRYFISIQCYLYAPREILSMEAQKEIRGKQWVGKRLEITIFIFI